MEGARKAFENNAKDLPSENGLSQVQIYFELAEWQVPLTIKEGLIICWESLKINKWLWKGL